MKKGYVCSSNDYKLNADFIVGKHHFIWNMPDVNQTKYYDVCDSNARHAFLIKVCNDNNAVKATIFNNYNYGFNTQHAQQRLKSLFNMDEALSIVNIDMRAFKNAFCDYKKQSTTSVEGDAFYAYKDYEDVRSFIGSIPNTEKFNVENIK